MNDYKVIGIDLAKTKWHIAAMNGEGRATLKRPISRYDFFDQLSSLFPSPQTFAMEACGGCHDVGRKLQNLGHQVILLRTQDVKPYAKSRQKNDLNDALAICKASLDPELKRVHIKTQEEQVVSFLHKTRQNVISQRIQRSNALISSLHEFGYIVSCGKAKFAKECEHHIHDALQSGDITQDVAEEMLKEKKEIDQLFQREKELDARIVQFNKSSDKAKRLLTIPGIGPINASILSNKPIETYATPRDFAASLGLVPKQHTTGGQIHLGRITKQGDRYARTMLIQAGRTLVMRTFKANVPEDSLYQFIERLKKRGKGYNVICVAVANKLARMAYACVMKSCPYDARVS